MSQSDLDCAVSHATGESLGTIRRRGFSLCTPLQLFDSDTDHGGDPQMVDWDDVDHDRRWTA